MNENNKTAASIPFWSCLVDSIPVFQIPDMKMPLAFDTLCIYLSVRDPVRY